MRLAGVIVIVGLLFSGSVTAQNCNGGMNSRALSSVLTYLNENNHELSRLSYAKDLLVRECLTCDQAIKIMKTFKSNTSRNNYFAELKKGYLVDVENIALIESFIANEE